MRDRDSNRKSAPATEFTLNLHRSSMGFGDMFHERQTKARTGDKVRLRGSDAMEFLENSLVFARRDADAVIRYGD